MARIALALVFFRLDDFWKAVGLSDLLLIGDEESLEVGLFVG